MKKSIFSLLIIIALSSIAQAAGKQSFAGSDTLAGAITDAIIQSGMTDKLEYIGGGSGNGEKGLVSGDQNIAPMSREMKPEVLQQLTASGLDAVPHVLALDGLSIFVKSNNTVASLDLATIVKIYTCQFKNWEQIPNSGMTGVIQAYRRDDKSGTTDAFKHFTGIKEFGSCVTAVEQTADISDVTSREVLAVGYSGLSGKVENNRTVAISAKAGSPAILPTTKTVRDFSYPMARKLYIYEVTGARKANDVEKEFLRNVTDRSFMDPIMQSKEFITID